MEKDQPQEKKVKQPEEKKEEKTVKENTTDVEKKKDVKDSTEKKEPEKEKFEDARFCCTPQCFKKSVLWCPKCRKMGLPDSFFCS